MKLTTHVLDVAAGRPGVGIAVTLVHISEGGETVVGGAVTKATGRTAQPLAHDLPAGTYELRFTVGSYYAISATRAFYDVIPVRFRIEDERRDYHVPLLISPFGYSTYLGQ